MYSEDMNSGVKVVSFALVHDWSEVVEDSYADLCKPHVVPKLLPLLRTDVLHGLTFNKDIAKALEIDIMSMIDALVVEVYREVELPFVFDVLFLEDNLEGILVHVLVEERTHLLVNGLATSNDRISHSPQLFGKRRVAIF